jgi:hypothetical protein
LWGKLKGRDHLGDSDVDGRIILRWIFRKWDVGVVDWIDLAQGRDSHCGNKPSGSIK